MAVSIQRDSGDILESTYEHFSEVRWTSVNFLSIHNLVFWDSQKFTMNASVNVCHWKFQLNQMKKNRLMAVSIQIVSGDIPESTYEHFSEVGWTSMNFLSIHNLVFWDSQKFTMNTSVNLLSIHNLVFWDSPKFTDVHFSERLSLKISAQSD